MKSLTFSENNDLIFAFCSNFDFLSKDLCIIVFTV